MKNSTEYDITNIDYTALGLRISACRFILKVTQEQLAELIGISVAYLSRIENGHKHPSLACVLRIAHALDVPATYLITGEGSVPHHISGNSEPSHVLSGNLRNSGTDSKSTHAKDQTLELIAGILNNCSSKEKLFAYEFLSNTIQLLRQYYSE